ncbi:MAG: hypothetical protein K2J04_10160, partial [Lachnospiraceae bacterium]|nr:hypothetical protein [Lachnospiraceae bacterium]
GWQRLADALRRIDDRIEEDADKIPLTACNNQSIQCGMLPVVKMPIAEALDNAQSGREVLLSEAEGEAAGDFINLYPPGIPLLVPGEVIDINLIEQIQAYKRLGLHVLGISETGTVIIC